MTVIMAATFDGGVALAADTLLHHPTTMQPVMNAAKTLVIGSRVAIAQAGTFDGTAEVLDGLERMDPATATPKTVANRIRQHAGAIHAAMMARGADPIIRYLVAGLEPDDTPVIHSVEIDVSKFNVFRGSGQVAALGVSADATSIATQAIVASLIPMSNFAKLDEWAQRVVRIEATTSPRTVGFPATLVVIRPMEIVHEQIEATSLHDPRLVGHFS